MDINKEPEHSLSSSDIPDNGDYMSNNMNDIWKEEYSIEIEYEAPVNLDDDNQDRNDFQTFRNINTDCPITIDRTATSSSRDPLLLTPCIEESATKAEALMRESVDVIMLENSVVGEPNFVCSVCGNVFPSILLLNQHVTLHGKSSFDGKKSEKLGMDFNIEPKDGLRSSNSLYDNDSHRNNTSDIWIENYSIDIEYEAPVDPKKAIRDESQRKSGKTPQIAQTGNEFFECDQCSFKAVNSCLLKKHKMSHIDNDKPFKCDKCTFQAVSYYLLHKHKLSHTAENPFKCDQCTFQAASYYLIKKHKMSHNDEKPFKCDQCNFKAVSYYLLKKHQVSHTGEKPFQCDQCDYKTVFSYILKSHQMSHTNRKPFECDRCDHKSAKLSDLKRHKMIHTGEKPFSCDQCAHKFDRFYSLKMHKRAHLREKRFNCE